MADTEKENKMIFKSTLHADKPIAGEIWLATTGNYYRIDEISGTQVSVTRLGYTADGNDYVSRKRHGDSHVFDIGSFPHLGRRIARNSAKFEVFLSRNAVNA